jgi:hypothetical protein
MNDYEAILAYAVFALVIFTLAMLWRRHRETAKKRYRLLNYHTKPDDTNTIHPA